MSNQVTETHIRTVVKLSIYKIISIVVSYFLSLAFGANPMQAIAMSLVALTIGSLHYYLYDRLCLLVPWGRDEHGNDTTLRSVIKTIVYRISVLLVIMVTARIVFLDDNLIAFIMASIKFLTHAATYFILERIFNRIEWGKVYKTNTLV